MTFVISADILRILMAEVGVNKEGVQLFVYFVQVIFQSLDASVMAHHHWSCNINFLITIFVLFLFMFFVVIRSGVDVAVVPVAGRYWL